MNKRFFNDVFKIYTCYNKKMITEIKMAIKIQQWIRRHLKHRYANIIIKTTRGNKITESFIYNSFRIQRHDYAKRPVFDKISTNEKTMYEYCIKLCKYRKSITIYYNSTPINHGSRNNIMQIVPCSYNGIKIALGKICTDDKATYKRMCKIFLHTKKY